MNYVAGLESEFLLDGSLDLMNLLSPSSQHPCILIYLGAEGELLYFKERWSEITNKLLGSPKCSLSGLGPFFSALLLVYLTAWERLEQHSWVDVRALGLSSLLPNPCTPFPRIFRLL